VAAVGAGLGCCADKGRAIATIAALSTLNRRRDLMVSSFVHAKIQ
jgi:hypothetical protein